MNRYQLIAFLNLLLLFSPQTLAQSSEAFMVEVKDEYTKVLAPDQYHRRPNVMIKNQTLVELRGRLESSRAGVLAHVSIPPKEYKSIGVTLDKKEQLKFVPLSPSLQAIELVFGQKSYEIPPKK